MATLTSIVSSPPFKPRLVLNCDFRAQQATFLRNWDCRSAGIYSRKLVRAQLRVPGDGMARFDMIKEKILQSLPDSAKDFEWKKAGGVLGHQLITVGRKVFIWMFIASFGCSFISDVIYSISVGKELLVPLGLFVGCLMTDFVKETSLEFFRHSESAGLERQLVGIGCFCVILKMISLILPVQGRLLLLHVANGGLLQVLWLWRSSVKENDLSAESAE